jgi:glyoxylase-like metal-dependent hydrolase (beta-lactamase superfamily II)
MRLTEEVYLVGGGDYGFNLTHRLDCHVYLIDGGTELALVDAGFGPGEEEILDLIRGDGFDPARISRIFITHYHADHVGGAAGLLRTTGAELWAPTEAAETIRVADADRIGLTWAQSFGFYPADYRWEPSEVAHEFSDGQETTVGGLSLRFIATPGHCDGHYVLVLEGRERTYLFASDLVFWGGAIILQNVPDANVQLYAESMNRVLAVDFDALLPGHHMISLRNGHRHVEAAAADFNRIGLPRDLLR